jgi:putative FmdB family regulatory protein
MPIYEYKCVKCDEVFEVRQKFSDEPLTLHEGCGGAVERLLSAPAFQFKGTGWYVTDYARGNGKSKDKGEKAEKGDKGEKSDSKTETKPETKAEAPKKTESSVKTDA